MSTSLKDLSNPTSVTTHNGDLRHICISQNLGAIDASAPGVTGEEIRLMINRFVLSMNAFLRALAIDMHTKSQRGSSTVPDSPDQRISSRDSSISVDAFDVVVLHLQEIGGKKRSEALMTALSAAVGRIYPEAGWCSGLIMNKKDCVETFTAMGAVVFVSKRIFDITSILSFKRNRTFVALEDDPVTYVKATEGKIEKNEDLLFAGKKFSDAGTSRKGYMLLSIRIGTQILNFVNVHMFHDDDNRIAVKISPSEYALRRIKGWNEMLAEVLPLIDTRDPCFIFGDLNTRLDGVRLMEFARNTFSLAPIDAKKSVERNVDFWSYVIQPRNIQQMLKFDLEVSTLMNLAGQHGLELGELPIQFPPTFTKEEFIDHDSSTVPKLYSQVDPATGIYRLERIPRPNKIERLPAFCDRILFNPEGLRLVSGFYSRNGAGKDQSQKPSVWKLYQYNSTVFDSTDHDCVYLAF